MRRINQNTFIVNDRVTLIDGYLRHEWTQKQPELKIERLKELVESGDNIRVSAIKTNKPVTAQTGHFEVVDDIWYDVVREAAPGLFLQVFTLPQEMLILHDDYPNLAPVPDSLRRDDHTNIKPEGHDIESQDDFVGPAKQTASKDADHSLDGKNVTLPGAQEPTPGESYTKNYINR
jgi:hypothetical protein